MEYFRRLQELLNTERKEDLRQYQKLTESYSAQERRSNGLTWYPVAIRGTEIGRGDYLILEVERSSHQDLSHQFRFGASVSFFSNHQSKTDRTEGTISHLNGNRMKITLKTEELPDWSSDGKLGVDLLFDNNSYDEMLQALKLAASIGDATPSTHKLIQIFTGKAKPQFNTRKEFLCPSKLNELQQSAVQKILSAESLAIVHGPPGTGKTTTLIEAIKAMFGDNPQQILVIAPSNTAVDLLSEKLTEKGLNVLRIGNPVRISANLQNLTLDSRMSAHKAMKDVKALKKQAAEFKNMAHKYKRNFGRAEQEQRKALFNEAHKIIKEAEKTEQYIIDQVVENAQIITATPVAANHYAIRNLKFNTIVIDEAGQALEPACWIPILKAEKVVLAGDHFQLPPTIKSMEAAQGGLNTTLLEKSVALHPEAVVLLQEQYRMHQTIMGYSSRVFYNNLLEAHISVKEHKLLSTDSPFQFIDTAGCAFDERTDKTNISNPEEAVFLLKQLSRYLLDLSTAYQKEDFPSIAVISPYQEQIRTLRDLMPGYPAVMEYAAFIAVNTIDSFQGQERDVVFISLTRSNTERTIGFLADVRRMNVAMTRARKKLVLIGDGATLSLLPFYSNLIAYAEEKEAYHSAWEFVTD